MRGGRGRKYHSVTVVFMLCLRSCVSLLCLVLQDEHERAWYDSHRDAILRGQKPGQSGGKGKDGEEDEREDPDGLNLFQYFSGSCYSDYNDGPDGFYTVYASIFEKLEELEVAAQREAGHEESRGVSAERKKGRKREHSLQATA